MSTSRRSPGAFELRSVAWTLTALRLHTADAAALDAALAERFGGSPLFDGDPVVLDFSALAPDDAAAADVAALAATLRRHRMAPIAVQGAGAALLDAARALGLAEAPDVPPTSADGHPRTHAPVPASLARPIAPAAPHVPVVSAAPVASVASVGPPSIPDVPLMTREVELREVVREVVREVPVETPAAASGEGGAAAGATMVVTRPLRSGQRIYARGADLVVLSTVSFGAEVIADGHIHVYAPLRGRAIAGARGNVDARVFCTRLEPQLVAIAGIYRTVEEPLPADVWMRPAQVRLVGERIVIEPLGG